MYEFLPLIFSLSSIAVSFIALAYTVFRARVTAQELQAKGLQNIELIWMLKSFKSDDLDFDKELFRAEFIQVLDKMSFAISKQTGKKIYCSFRIIDKERGNMLTLARDSESSQFRELGKYFYPLNQNHIVEDKLAYYYDNEVKNPKEGGYFHSNLRNKYVPFQSVLTIPLKLKSEESFGFLICDSTMKNAFNDRSVNTATKFAKLIETLLQIVLEKEIKKSHEDNEIKLLSNISKLE